MFSSLLELEKSCACGKSLAILFTLLNILYELSAFFWLISWSQYLGMENPKIEFHQKMTQENFGHSFIEVKCIQELQYGVRFLEKDTVVLLGP